MIDLASIQVPLDTVLRLIVWADVCVAAAFLVAVIVLGICCGAESMRERRKHRASRRCTPEPPVSEATSPLRVRRIRTVLGSGALCGTILLALCLTACAPQLQHLDGSALHPIGQLQAIENGWVAFDSCASGIHALVEIQLETGSNRSQLPDLEKIALRLASSDRWRPGRVHVEGPFCTWSGPARVQEPQVAHLDDQVNRLGYGSVQVCTYVVQAQFNLDRLPTPRDSVVVVHGQRLMHLAWR